MFPKYKNKKNLYSNLNNDDSDDDNILSTIGAFSIGADSDSDEDGGEALRSMPHLPKPSASTFSTGDAPISLKKRAANLYTTLTFDWLKPLLDMGNDKDQLDPSDLPPMFDSDKTEMIGRKFETVWKEKLRVQKEKYNKLRSKHPKGMPPKFIELEKDVKRSTTPLAPVLFGAFGGPFAKAGVLKFIHDLCAFVGPNVLKALIRFLKDPGAPVSTGVGLTVLVTLSQLTMSLCLRQYFYQCYRTGLRLRSSVIIAVYKKALKLASSERNSRTSGEITNLMSVDAQRLQDLTPYLHAIWYSFLQIGLAIYFLWQELGASCLGGVAIIIIMMPITKKVGKYLGGLQKKLMKVKDERLKINNEVLSGVKVIKLQAWEKSFEDKIEELRNEEVSQLRTYMLFQALSGTLWSTVPLLVAVATFTAYVASGQELEVEVALTSLALFEILRFPLFMLPNVINNLVEASVSVGRLESFLRCKEQKDVTEGGMKDNGIEVDGATFIWEGKRVLPDESNLGEKDGEGKKNEPEEVNEDEWEVFLLQQQLREAESHIKSLMNQTAMTNLNGNLLDSTAPPPPPQEEDAPSVGNVSSLLALRRVHMDVKPGQLVAVVGAVGSGKSTLLNGLLGECRALVGNVKLKGKVAYAAQKAFIMNDTLRKNITFSNSFDDTRYRETVQACALAPDLKVLPGGDQVEIGEKGINLSGGQKARVSLARAVYEEADIYLLDDPLSAVDAHVGKHLFNECIVDKLLKGDESSVVLVTNALQFLNNPRVNKIVVLEGGKITEEGTFDELMGKVGGSFNVLLSNYRESSSESMGMGSGMGSRVGSSVNLAGEGATVDLKQVAEKAKEIYLNGEGGGKEEAGKKLITNELKERETGSVTKDVYLLWARSMGGYSTACLILLCYVFVEGCNIMARWWLSYWSEHSGGGEGTSQGKFLAVYAGINLVIVLAMFVRQLYLYLSSLRAAKTLYMRLLKTIIRAPMSFFDTTPLGRILNRFSKDTYTLDQQLSGTVRMYLGTLGSVIGTIFVICTVTPWFTITLPPILYFYLGKQRYFTKTYRELKRLDSVSRSPIYALFGETLEGVATIRAFKAQGGMKKRITRLLNENQTAFFLTFSAQCWLAVRLEMVGTIMITFACLFAVMQHGVQAGNEAFAGAAGLSISFALSVTQSLNWSVRMSSDLEAQMVSVERVNQYIANVKPEAARETEVDKRMEETFPKGEIVFDNVRMRYRPGLPEVLKGLDLKIPEGSKVGVVGRTGAGKSSIMVALMRIVELSGGRILLDGVDSRELGLGFLRSKLAIVPQDPVLFSGSIRTNLDPFCDFDDSRLGSIMRRVGLMGDGGGERVASLDERVEEDGGNFSVGQRQLVVIARALLSECSIVLMDEATAAIDVDTDQKIQRAIREEFAGATVITVAHRLNTIMDADLILVMDDGKMAEFDRPERLLENENGMFRGLVQAYESSHE